MAGEIDISGSYVRLNTIESPTITLRSMPNSSGPKSVQPSASYTEHYVRKKNITKYSASWKTLIPYRRKTSVTTELPLDHIGFLTTVTYGWMTSFMKKSWNLFSNESVKTAQLDSCDINSQRMKDFLQDENVKRGQLNARILYTAWCFVRTRVLIAAVIYIMNATMYIAALIYFLTWFLETKEMFNLLILILLFSGSLVLLLWSNSMTFRTANRLQSAFISVMYKQLLRISVLNSVAAQRIVTVMIADSEKVHEAVAFLPIVLSAPFIILLSIAMILMKMNCYSVQEAAFAVFTLILTAPILYLLARVSNVWKSHMYLYTGKRMVSLQEMLLHLPLVKMTIREKLFHRNAADLRKKECHYMRKVNICDSVSVTFLHVVSLLVAVLLWHQSKSNKEMMSNDCEKANLFSVIILLLIPLKELLFNFWYGTIKIFDGLIAFRRLKCILLLSCVTKTSFRKPINHLIALSMTEASYDIKVGIGDRAKKKRGCGDMGCNHAEEDELEMETKNILRDISLAAPKEKLIGICGDASSGKTALIFALLQQISQSCYGGDKLQRDGTYAYVGQNPWIMEGTLQENILFNEALVPKKYYHIVHCCSLNDDIGQMPGGDQTLITDKMVTLDQKQRIGLARALYANRDIYLLDDVLSAVSSDLGLMIFKRALQNYLKEKTVIITTRQVKFLRLCDEIFVLKKGKIVENGTHNDLMEKKLYPILIKSYLQETSKKEIENVKFYSESSLPRKYELSGTNSYVTVPDSFVEESAGNSVDLELKYNGCISFFRTMTFETQTTATFVTSLFLRVICVILVTICPILILRYFLANGLAEGIIVCGLILTILIFRIVGTTLYDKITYDISLHIHHTWVENICKCCLNIFQSTSHAEILQWFSTHLFEIDTSLPSFSILLLENALLALLLLFMLVICSFWFLIPVTAILFVGYFLHRFAKTAIAKFYLQEDSACTQLNSFVSSSIMGRVTIQAYGREREYLLQFYHNCDKLLAYSQLRKAALSWLTFWIHIISLSFIMIVLGSVCIENQITVDMKRWIFPLSEDHITVIIIFCVILFGYILNNVMQSSFSLSSKFNILGHHDASIRAIKQEEENLEMYLLASPLSNGSIKFDNVKLEFWPDSPTSWRGLSFEIQAGEKIGILGHPGSGKTAIIGALYKLASLTEGSVSVGGIDLNNLQVESIRSSIALVPKNPVLFSGTLRLNVDPMQKHSNRELNDCLEKVGLLQTVNDLPYQIDTHVHNLEGKLSIEERQLLYVAQAVLRDPKVLILEEPIQPMGKKNMLRVEDIVSKLFHCTILIVANNLKYASVCDKIIIVKDGQVVEFDTQDNLFRNPNSCYSQMLFLDSDNSLETEV